MRVPRAISNPGDWFACADLLQMNEQEMSLIASDPMALSATAMQAGVQSLLVTLGKRGVVYVLAPGFDRLEDLRRTHERRTGPVRTALVPAVPADSPGDPTGCGDVFGATYFSRLLSGDTFAVALRAALNAASRNVVFRGAGGLASFLRGELLRT
jgi:sugar/nucleoside kinase (ribokinase family)